ncbi:TonB-dependent receptor [Tamlana sp. 2_MG-2023]|uniref:TonB-dependent receptor plug domain-containing protein n=1 Tax=unclassified Tamlana TaxID=2614803 RepID=UPI0026E14DBB|nr:MULTISPECIES: TonB-dependent receptor [unclassified Tamlana]MDO6760046.1 TonB-dependent receptor [Tamlana sp. 2_MG-2023]MDO6790256.1 TonB-dependent receptor [Tamlana sp. 1_MG-2023]
MHKKTHVFGILCLGMSLVGFAQEQEDSAKLEQLDEVVISDSRFELKRENSGKTVIKISSEDIEKNQGRTVAELINAQSGVEINGSRSNAGQNLGVYVRGGRNRQVLVIVDGVQIGDPSQINGEYDFRLLNLSQIESIEIIKGAASTLYGSGAATAVINITTKKASSKKISAVVGSSIGTNQSQDDQDYDLSDFNNSVTLGGTLDKFTYRAAFSQQYTDGMSAVITDANEKDPFSKLGVDVNLGYNFSDAFSIGVFGNFTDIESGIDGYDASFSLADTDDQFNSDQSRVGMTAKYTYKNGSVNFNGAYSEYNREFISDYPSVFESKNYIFDLYNKYVFDESFYTIVGVNVLENEALFDEEKKFTIVDPYANVVYVSKFGLNVNMGGRLNNHSEYGTHFTYNVNPSFVFKKDNDSYSKVFASYSTSFIAPSLSQLHGYFGANPDLKPEENKTIEGGLEFKFSNNFRVSGLYFNREEENFFIYDNTLGYLNSADLVRFHGVEFEVNATPIKNLTVTANYMFAENKEGQPVRIPEHKGNLLVGYDFCPKTFASLSYQYTGDRLDNGDVTLDSFSLVNFYISHTVLENKIKFFAGIDNILNEDYLEISQYTTKGRNVRVGLQLTL